jgi:hypothetical protein
MRQARSKETDRGSGGECCQLEEEERVGDGELKQDFLADDDEGIYYAGDFCTWRPPGVEAAALSGLHTAQHIARICN